MSGIALTVPYLDTEADHLCFALGLPAREALAVRDLTVDGIEVQLRLLGASHQVFAGPVRETVACLPGTVDGLPAAAAAEFDGWSYHFSARVEECTAAEFSERVAGIRGRVDGCPAALCGVFPGSPDALTALTVEGRRSGLDWRTWHTYPKSRQIVATHTRLERR